MTVPRTRSLILLVDDSPTQARRAAQALETAGFRVQLASNGREALEKARQWRPDVIVSDILMPVMDGFALCREVRRDRAVGDVPIVLHTLTYVDTKDEEFALALGATRFVLKPSDPADLVGEVRAALATGHVHDRHAPAVDNEAFLKGYSERLAAKLEDKLTELEAANRRLALEHQETMAARDRLALLLEVSQLAASSLDLGVMLRRVAERIVTAVGVTFCRVCLFDSENDLLAVQAAHPIRALDWEPAIDQVLALGNAPIHQAVLATGEPRVIQLDTDSSPMSSAERDAAGLRQAKTVLLVPMNLADEPIGLIQIGEARGSDRNPITGEQVDLARAMAGQVTVAVKNARLHRAQVEAEREVRALNERLEQRVRDRTTELEAAVQELEAFSYSVSHDLRAPLRSMDGFSRILIERHAETVPEDARGYLERIRGSAQRMSRLIDDLLEFARLSRKPLTRRTVYPTRIVRDVLDELAPDRQGRETDVKVGELPPCEADPALLRQVIVNLLQNALKFTRQKPVAHIDVGIQTVGDERAYYVRDNGAGFDMQYAEKLFGVFQRLHRATEFEGTGVGLAICQRIVHRHGGRIWADAVPGQGATFYFTIGRV